MTNATDGIHIVYHGNAGSSGVYELGWEVELDSALGATRLTPCEVEEIAGVIGRILGSRLPAESVHAQNLIGYQVAAGNLNRAREAASKLEHCKEALVPWQEACDAG